MSKLEAACNRAIDIETVLNKKGVKDAIIYVYRCGKDIVDVTVSLYSPSNTREIAHMVRKAAGVSKVKKSKPWTGSEDIHWKGRNEEAGYGLVIKLNGICKVIGHKEVIVPAKEEEIIPEEIIPATPATTKQVPIWDCSPEDEDDDKQPEMVETGTDIPEPVEEL